MLYREVPKSGDKLSIQGFGAMRLPKKDGGINHEKATALIRHAIDNGVNYIDTAWTYHGEESEKLLGNALAEGYRERVRIATKMPHWLVSSRQDMDKFLELQLKRLRTDHIDYYLIHSLTASGWMEIKEKGVLEFLDTAKKDGRIKNAGFSFHDNIKVFKEIIDSYDWDICLIQYNYLDENHQAGTEGLKYAAEKDIGVIVMEPLRGGSLATNVPPEVEKNWEGADVKRTPAEWGLRWIWNHPEVTVVLSGMSDKSQLDENIRTASEAYPDSLAEDELDTVRRAAKKYKELATIPCTGCNYCMPCPAGVDIPGCFDLYNSSKIFGGTNDGGTQHRYLLYQMGILGERSSASLCVNCGKCKELCPQKIDIPEWMKEVEAQFEQPVVKFKASAMRLVLPVFRRVSFLKYR
ncbi:aldo/keto reductase [Methanolobus halotolerans]|uniref:Aldo/keto reductase n=1 Tax=Methanolobus halotolerans TaxID=2052935 RepID=A0A4E0PWH5_9EURY|nr:aldo/keto reductase [Methanolobus halotolerans]TGC09731.1 aldo/keto reductase [Methanolobus halotolerans]